MGSSSKAIGSPVLMHYDRAEDILYFAFKKGKAHEVVEGSEGNLS